MGGGGGGSSGGLLGGRGGKGQDVRLPAILVCDVVCSLGKHLRAGLIRSSLRYFLTCHTVNTVTRDSLSL